MSQNQKKYLFICLLLAVVYFGVFYFPNSTASTDINMVKALSPDEAVPLPYVFDMIKPADTLKQALINFAFYDYYFYGYPHFAVSALSLLPLALVNRLGDTQLVMTVLRQVVSVLPMLLAMLGLVYLQTRFRSYKSIVLFTFLLSVPALVQNNYWWHPDSLAILFAVGAVYFLDCDNLRFGRNFYLSALMCGIAAQIKGIGFYFFLAVFVYLLIGLIGKKASKLRLAASAAGFLAAMALAYFASNPILIYPGVREHFFGVMRDQARLLTQGYEIAYARGLQAAWPLARENFGEAIFLLAAFAAGVWGAIRGQRRLLHTIILAWAIPITVMVISLIHFKPQYWLPAALPLFSCLAIVLPDRLPRLADFKFRPQFALPMLAMMVVLTQFGLYIRQDVQGFAKQLNREKNEPSIIFASKALEVLSPLKGGQYYVYHDVNMYMPPRSDWVTESIFEMLDYDYIQQHNFDVVMIMEQRIHDYINPNAVAIDAAALAKSQIFYRDAEAGKLQGYALIYRDDFGLIFVKNTLNQRYFALP